MTEPQIRELALEWFTRVGGSNWASDLNLGLWSLAFGATILALVTASAAMATRDGA